MTKISKKSAYPVKIPVRKDYFVGTDSENNGKTVNFDFESTARLINDLNGTPILNYIFRTDSNIDLTVLTEGVFLSAGNETTITSISKLYINKNNFHETDMSDLFRFIAINREAFSMKLRNSSNLTNAVYFKITGATEYETHFTLDVAIDINNASLLELINYNVYFFDFELSSSDLAITLPEFNKIITETGFSSTETEITFNPLWVWLIKNVSYSNNSSVTKITTPTTIGSKRIDVFVLNSSNTFQTISGAETTGSPVKPTIPLDTLEVTFCIVGDGGIETVEPINIIDYATIVYVDSKDVLKVDKVTGKSLISDTEIIRLAGVSNADVSGKANLAGTQTFTGIHNFPTATSGTSTNQVATTAFVTGADAGNVKLTGSQTISGLKTFTNNIFIDDKSFYFITSNFSYSKDVTRAQIKRLGDDIAIATANSDHPATFNTLGLTLTRTFAFPNQSGTFALANNPTSLTATSFINSTAPATNILLADGSTIAQSSISVDVSGKVDKVAGERLINASEITKLSQQSGTNTGDETLSTIKTKLGITTLSGSNTGDQDLSVKVDKVAGKSLISDTEITRLAGVSNVDISGKENTITAGTTAQYYRGDKTMQTLDKTTVGLANVDNTTDLSKPISSATQTAINLKANLASPTFTGVPLAPTATAGTNTTQIATTAFVTDADAGNVKLTGNQSISGIKTISGNLALQGRTWLVNSFPNTLATGSSFNDTNIGLNGNKFAFANQSTGIATLNPTNAATTKVDFSLPSSGGTIALTSNPTSITATSFINSTAPATNALLANGTTLANPISGTGTTGYLPKFTSAGVLGNSIVQEIGSEVRISGQVTAMSGTNGRFNIGSLTNYLYGDNLGNIILGNSGGDRVSIAPAGESTFSSSITAKDYKISALNTAPASATATGTLGEIRITAGFIYVCTATNTWVRTALATW